ncbi:MAG: serine phosphatase RsbU (regulator of sigma subunit) [Candidatus Azotimanducaceae bacterium]|jgi:serine phosphatase RsbU (regulator of sigma subunit)
MGGFSGDLILSAPTSRETLFVMLGDFTGHGLPAALGALPVSQQFQVLASVIWHGNLTERFINICPPICSAPQT